MNKIKTLLMFVFVGCSVIASAQRNELNRNDFSLALDLFQNQKYSAAQQHFIAIQKSPDFFSREQIIDAEY